MGVDRAQDLSHASTDCWADDEVYDNITPNDTWENTNVN
jgi:hypothetical protein